MAGFYPRTPEQNKKHSLACKGKTGTWKRTSEQNIAMSKKLKGRTFSPEHLKKLAEAMKKRWQRGDFRVLVGKDSPGWRGGPVPARCLICQKEFKILSAEVKQRGNFCSLSCWGNWISENLKGEKSYGWKGGITPINHLVRRTRAYKRWRSSVFERDNYTCKMPGCGVRGTYLIGHHIKKFEKYPELRFDINNGITLCIKCHETTKGKEEKFEEIFYEILRHELDTSSQIVNIA